MKDKWKELTTEAVNRRSAAVDALPAEKIARIIASEDSRAIRAVATVSPEIGRAAEIFSRAILAGRRVLYVGAGTSGRLGVLDAAELPPTYGLPKAGRGSALGLIAGGSIALRRSVEGAEDDGADSSRRVKALGIGRGDLVIGISASSLAPYVREALRTAKKAGASTVLVTMNRILRPAFVDHLIAVVTGPEVVSGSTRMKAGLATKAILHNISTTAMILSGKVHGNRMVDLKCWCEKLRARGTRLVSDLGGVPPARARRLLQSAEWNVKPAIVMARLGCDHSEAGEILAAAGGRLRKALQFAGPAKKTTR